MQESDQTYGLLQQMLDDAQSSFDQDRQLAERAIAQLSDDELKRVVWPGVNSVAVIMKHVAGNLRSRWTEFLSTDGEKPWRNRDKEFEDTFSDRHDLEQYWDAGWRCLGDALQNLRVEDLSTIVKIRGESYSVMRAIDRSQSHCAYHVGQIVTLCRVLRGEQWQYLTIPPGESEQFNRTHWQNDP